VVILSENLKAKVNTFIAIPYNPYEAKSYEYWTIIGIVNLGNELKVAEDFWNFLIGEGRYL
jgi:type II restriction enzyme